MVYHGHIANGTVVIDAPDGLPDGAKVEIRILTSEEISRDKEEPHWLDFSGAIDSLPPDASQRVDEILYGRPNE